MITGGKDHGVALMGQERGWRSLGAWVSPACGKEGKQNACMREGGGP